jgi:hypothetical protein
LKEGLCVLVLYRYLHGRTEVKYEKPIKIAGSLVKFQVDNSQIFLLPLVIFLVVLGIRPVT